MSAAATPASARAACATSTIKDSMSRPSCLPNLLCAQPTMQPLMPPSTAPPRPEQARCRGTMLIWDGFAPVRLLAGLLRAHHLVVALRGDLPVVGARLRGLRFGKSRRGELCHHFVD